MDKNLNLNIVLTDAQEKRVREFVKTFHTTLRSFAYNAILEYLDVHESDDPPVYIGGMPEWEYKLYKENQRREDEKEARALIERQQKEARDKERQQIENYRKILIGCNDTKELEYFEEKLRQNGGHLWTYKEE